MDCMRGCGGGMGGGKDCMMECMGDVECMKGCGRGGMGSGRGNGMNGGGMNGGGMNGGGMKGDKGDVMDTVMCVAKVLCRGEGGDKPKPPGPAPGSAPDGEGSDARRKCMSECLGRTQDQDACRMECDAVPPVDVTGPGPVGGSEDKCNK